MIENIKKIFGFLLVLIGVASTVIELGTAISEPSGLSHISNILIIAVFLPYRNWTDLPWVRKMMMGKKENTKRNL